MSKNQANRMNFPSAYKSEFVAEAKSLKLPQSDLFAKLWEAYKSGSLMLEESSKIDLPETPQELSAAERRVWEKINEILYWNSYCKPEERAFISPSLVRRYHAAAYPQIKKVLEMRQSEINAHHKCFNIFEDANRKGRNSQGQQIKVEELIGSYSPEATTGEVDQSPLGKLDEHLQESEGLPLPRTEPEVKSQPVVTEISSSRLSPIEYFDLLKDESNVTKHRKLSGDLLESFRSELNVKVTVNAKGQLKNEGEGEPAKLDQALEQYRKLFREYPLTAKTRGYRHLSSPKIASSFAGGKPPEGSKFNKDGSVIATPRHLAIEFLTLSEIENAYMNLSRDAAKYKEFYPNYELA
jgi:hypothetical protein